MATDQQGSGGRVLVLLDGSPLSRSALTAAADIADARGADVLGIFVEETNLLRSGGYLFAREVGASSGQIRPLDTSRIEARMQSLARRAGMALEQVMLDRGIRQALKLCRGHVVGEVLNLARPEDLLILGRAGWSASPGMMLGSTARALVRRAPGEVLLWCDNRPRAHGRVVVLLNHDQGANHRAADVGADLARRYQQPLTMLVRTGSDDERPVTDDLRSYLEQTGIIARVRCLPMTGAEEIIRALQEENAAQLVLSRSCRLFNEPEADAVMGTINLPITVTQ
ncbi:universal stress protein [Marinobacter lacisalsi]|uniref:Universal stress protein n=1 Tax=Marinobacter lacisalsi TaxID=475979 RepID=A0ABV8QEX6_9GAMM